MNPLPCSSSSHTWWSLAIVFLQADPSEESLSCGSWMCLCCSFCIGRTKAGNVSSSKTRRGGFPSLLIKCLGDTVPSVFWKPDVKTKEERGTPFKPRPVPCCRFWLYKLQPGSTTALPFFLFIYPYIHSLVLDPVYSSAAVHPLVRNM